MDILAKLIVLRGSPILAQFLNQPQHAEEACSLLKPAFTSEMFANPQFYLCKDFRVILSHVASLSFVGKIEFSNPQANQSQLVDTL